MQLEGTTIRIACNQAARDSFVNALGGQPPTLPRAGSVRMPCAIFLDDPSVADHLLTDLGNLDAAHCVIRAGNAAGAVLFEQIVPAANFNPALTFAQWTAGTAAHFEFVLMPADTNLPAGPLHIAIGVTTAAGGDIPLAYCATARLRDYGIFNATAPAALSMDVVYPALDNRENLLQIPLPRVIEGEMEFSFSRGAACLLIVALSCAPFRGAADDMLSVQRTTGGVILLDLRGIANATYVLQYCEDLSAPNWTDLATGTADNQGRWQTTDDTASQTAHRFYRARLVTVGAINLYVDSAGGDDANSGATVPTALRTLAAARSAALTHGTGVKIGLLSGSHWRESLDLSSVTNATVQAVGTGPAPVIDGADVVAAWTKTTGRTNVYQATITHDATASNRLTVYEDGALLSRVADQATCDSTPGSFVDAKGSDGSPLTIYLRPAAAGSPATNGHLYEVTTRYAALLLGQGASVAGVQTQRQIDNNGSLDAVNVPGVTISRILALDGTKHNLGIGSGTVSDCITARNDPPTSYEVSNTAFVAFLNDGTGQNALFERCGAILCARGTVDFLTHGGVPLAAVTTRQCWTVGASFGSQVGTTVGNYYQAVLIAPTTSGTLSQTLVRLRADGGVSTVATYGATSISDSVFLAEERVGAATPNYAEMFRLQGATTLAHCAFGGLTGNTNWFANDNSSAALTMNYCVFDGGVNHISTGGGGTYAGDHNVFRPTNVYNPAAQIECATPAGYKETLAAWQAYSGQDAHSVYLSSTDQSAGSANAFWLGVKNAATGTDLSTVGPAAGDWRVNPAARVYGADGTAYAGTFPDGTAITQAGPQTRWDWNARASAAGAPAAWPNVPATVADAQAYVLHPDAWVF